MGEVYRATGTRLHRYVAIKICAERFSARFEREARAVGALNHPNMGHLYDVGPDYLVMELIEGETLAERINHGAIPMEEALVWRGQIVDALEVAHEKLRPERGRARDAVAVRGAHRWDDPPGAKDSV